MTTKSTPATTVAEIGAKSLVSDLANRFGVDDNKLVNTLKATCFRAGYKQDPVTNEELMMLLVIVKEHGLNPFTKEIYAFRDRGAVVPIVSIDGWARIINSHPQMDGIEFVLPEDGDEWQSYQTLTGAKRCPDWMECCLYRKDRERPIVLREYLDEVYQPPRGEKGIAGPWQTHTKRMLRWKVMIQCARVAFSFAGIYDEDEGQRIIEGQFVESDPAEEEIPAPRRKSDSVVVDGKFKADQTDDDEQPSVDATVTNGELLALKSALKDSTATLKEYCDAFGIKSVEQTLQRDLEEAMKWAKNPGPRDA